MKSNEVEAQQTFRMKLTACLALQISLVLLPKAEGGISAKDSDKSMNEVTEGVKDQFPSNFVGFPSITPMSMGNAISNSLEKQTDQTKREFDTMVNSMMEDARSYFPPMFPRESPTTQRKTFKWDESTKTNFAKKVFEVFIQPLLKYPKEYVFENLIFAVLCSVAGESRVILQMKLSKLHCKKITANKTCTKSNEKPIYCSWIGNRKEEKPKKMLGGACYQSKKISKKDEQEMAELDVCSDWRYGNTQFHRLGIPEKIAKSKNAFLSYYPPVVGNLYSGSNAIEDPKRANMPVNPKGKTGIAGHGLLRYWGENIMEIPIIIRKTGKYSEVLITDRESKEHTNGPLPMFYESSILSEKKKYNRSELSAEEYFSTLVKPEDKKTCTPEIFRLARKYSREIFYEYIPHPYATDNAWVVGRIYVVRVEIDPCYNSINLTQPENYLHYRWKQFNSSTIHSAFYLAKYANSNVKWNTMSATQTPYAQKYVAAIFFAALMIGLVCAAITISFTVFGIAIAVLFLAAIVYACVSRRNLMIAERLIDF